MVRLFALASVLALSSQLFAESKPEPKKGIDGYWLGTLKISAIELRLGFDIKKKDDGTLSAALDSIDQGARNVPIETATFADDTLTL
ncbi:MAG: hypothetical protein J2P46_18870, partial [Zavarzinella sp.]|nr:hypothetical protein [Zavarzinella sp.]